MIERQASGEVGEVGASATPLPDLHQATHNGAARRRHTNAHLCSPLSSFAAMRCRGSVCPYPSHARCCGVWQPYEFARPVWGRGVGAPTLYARGETP